LLPHAKNQPVYPSREKVQPAVDLAHLIALGEKKKETRLPYLQAVLGQKKNELLTSIMSRKKERALLRHTGSTSATSGGREGEKGNIAFK